MQNFDRTKLYNLFFQSIKSFAKINEATEKALQRLGINTIRDLIFYKPTSYNVINLNPDLMQVRHGDLIQAEVIFDDILRPMSRKAPMKILVSNGSGFITLVFFNKIHHFIYSKLRVGQKYIIFGKIEIFERVLQITHPEFIFNKDFNTEIMPIYSLTYGIVNRQLYGYIIDAINFLEKAIIHNQFFDQKDYFVNLINDIKALHFINYNPKHSILEIQDLHCQKLAAMELFANQASLAKLRIGEHKPRGRSFKIDNLLWNVILSKLGFELTHGQKEAIEDIQKDQTSNLQMMRLLQGDVGSGKTLVAMLTILNVVLSGAQAALMVPTDLLSTQHYQFFCQALADTEIKCAILTSKTSAKQRKQIQEGLLNGNINILIGTHALFQENVEFRDLGYVIIDEQHKFGVEQRLELIKKASNPDVLVMTATPIPRSLTLTMFGDMDVSQIKTKPKNRIPIITTIVSTDKKQEIIASLGKKLNAGEKLYWVCPLIDQSDKSIKDSILDDDKFTVYADVTSRFKELDSAYPNQVLLIHGKIKNTLKDEIMQEFKENSKNILVTTTVIEVGIDIPESTLIIIENAEKFGLAQLHQLRGRVGRGHMQSHCVLMYNPKRLTKIGRERLKIMRESSDGFYIAEQDLVLRGGGEILGTKQSGEPVFFFANLTRDMKSLLSAHQLAKTIKNDQFIDFQIDLFTINKMNLIQSG